MTNCTFAGSGGGGNKGGHIAANNLFSNATLRVLDLISEGQIGGLVDGAKSVFFDDVPVQNESGTYNYEDVSIDWTTGTPDQPVLKDFGSVITPQQVGKEVKKEYPVIEAIDNANADEARIVVSLPAIYRQDSKGNIESTSVTIRFELALNNTGNWKSLGDFKIEGKQNSQYSKMFKFDLPQLDDYGNKPSKWLIKMTRISEDSSEKYQARTVFDSIYVVNSTQLNYPYSALVGISVDAQSINSIPTRSYLVDGLIIQVPSNYDKATNSYRGIWDGTFKMEVSDNPAWILYALLTNKRWGLGEHIKPENINKVKLYEIGRYCDEEVDDGYGKKEKRFSINTQIQQRSDAYRLISDIAAVFRGMAFWAGGMANFTCDKPTEPTMLYNPSNVINGSFVYSGAARTDRHSVALVSWNDPEQNYKQVVEYVEDSELIAKWGIKQAEITAFGCTSRAQAIRVGRWILYTESYESESIAFDVGLDSALVLPGDVIKIQDPSYSGKRLGGRLLEITATSAKLDAPVELSVGNDSIISIRLPSGDFVERNIIVSYDGERQYVEWNQPLTEIPSRNAIWLISEASLKPIIARVINVQQGDEKNTYRITAISHEPKKYDLIEKGIRFEKDPTTANVRDVGAPKSPRVEEESTTIGLGYIDSKLVVSWLGGINCVSYELMWRRENFNETQWETITTSSKIITLSDVQRGTYHFKLRGVGLIGSKSPEVEFFHVANGRYVTPLDVTDFEVIKRPSYLEVRWKPAEKAVAYEVRCGNTWDSAEVLTTGFSGISIVHYQYEAGTYFYHIRSISSSGEYSENITTYRLDLKAPAMPLDLVATVSQARIDFTWKSNKEPDLSHYELREGLSWKTGTKVAESKVNQMSIPSGSDVERTFWLKAIALPKIYSDDAAWVKIKVANDYRRNIVITHNARQLQWPSNMVNMKKTGNDIIMNDGAVRSEYIASLALPDEIEAQNSFFSLVTVAVAPGDDTETWDTATYPWHSDEAQRSWRLGGNASSLLFENQSAKYIGVEHETESMSLENTLDTTMGLKPQYQSNISYDWGRYAKGLRVNSNTGVSWNGAMANSSFKMSFWVKVSAMAPNMNYTITKIGNSSNSLKVSYNTASSTFTLVDLNNRAIVVGCPIGQGDHVFIGISQSNSQRTLAICPLGRTPCIKSVSLPSVGSIDKMYLGTQTL